MIMKKGTVTGKGMRLILASPSTDSHCKSLWASLSRRMKPTIPNGHYMDSNARRMKPTIPKGHYVDSNAREDEIRK